ncbi:MAG: hypothetical protein OQL09_03380 [Gammaproteobacteria bacterium]|nr:hypothetical protein [Gammaproteobacteria bacterium]
MNKSALILFGLIFSLGLASCSGDIDGFTGSGSSSTNIISDKNFSVFFDETNPAVIDDDGGHGGVVVNITIYAADRFDAATSGNTVYIKSQWGTLDSNTCTTTSGSCSVKWTSNSDFSFLPFDLLNTITVYALGEESFTDLNGNGYFDDGDIFLRDLSEPFHDLDHDGIYTASVDETIERGDLDNSGDFTAADGKYNGTGCTHSTLCGSDSRIYLFDIGFMDMDARTLKIFIASPASGTSVTSGTNINFVASAIDEEDGVITGTDTPVVGDDISWFSSIDGAFGANSNNITVNTLSVGTHIITATVTDSTGNTASYSILVTIT